MLYDKLKKYSETGIYPFHMPGHKRNSALFDGTIPYEIDLTEIDGFDNLQNADGCIKAIEDKASHLYGVNRAFMLVNGATAGILAAIRSFTGFGDTVIVMRNCHKSVYNAIELCGLNAVYAVPNTDKEFGISSSITPEQIEKLLRENKNTKLIIITSPTYEGVVSDIKAISETASRFGVPVFVDEAHGAHFPFSSAFPSEAVSLGATAAVVSLHKTLPSLTQTALLITNSNKYSDAIAENLSVFQTSSPSYILMSSVERCLDIISSDSGLFERYIRLLTGFSKGCKAFKRLKILCFGNDAKNNHSFFDFDKSKIIISTRNTELNGHKLAEILRSKYKIELEMAYSDYVIAMTSVCDTKEGFERLFNALLEIDEECKQSKISTYTLSLCALPLKAFNACERKKHSGNFIKIKNAANTAALEYIWTYPPGVPLLVPGEIITQDIISKIDELEKSGVRVISSYGKAPQEIFAVDSLLLKS